MTPYRTKRRWKESTYMRLSSKERFRTFVITREDLDAYKAGRPIDFRKVGVRRLARRTGVSHTIISMLATGKRTTCSVETAEAISEGLGVDVTVLFDPEETTPGHRNAS